MSIVEDLGARVRATVDELPVALLTQALERLNKAAERLRWVRQESQNPMGVPELTASTEHLEAAKGALLVAEEQLASYLAAIGLARDGGSGPAPEPGADRRDRTRRPQEETAPEGAGRGAPADTGLRRWWPARVAELTGGEAPRPGDPPAAEPTRRITDPAELLRRVTAGVRAGDRAGLRRELGQVEADVGLGLATVAPPLLRGLATDLLGHPPRAEDLPRLRRELDGGVTRLLPGLPPAVLDTLLSRVCRMPPPPRRADEQANPADPAVAAGVLAGLLMHRVGRDERPAVGSTRETHG
ncbi:hypothetical protein [Plantactinospora sp. KBS50]|uniref:hypothetical protein n=1 Tax=Plantactinospora sp. KBS50 TaxID=2024580 RepID=UPI000BAB2065|nr:hypothetical protein [Plantactinospora sp. KBS50]ASW55027.1 hypothetical protein CIK06_13805 [Plantactinospora sp. KBS50]